MLRCCKSLSLDLFLTYITWFLSKVFAYLPLDAAKMSNICDSRLTPARLALWRAPALCGGWRELFLRPVAFRLSRLRAHLGKGGRCVGGGEARSPDPGNEIQVRKNPHARALTSSVLL